QCTDFVLAHMFLVTVVAASRNYTAPDRQAGGEIIRSLANRPAGQFKCLSYQRSTLRRLPGRLQLGSRLCRWGRDPLLQYHSGTLAHAVARRYAGRVAFALAFLQMSLWHM